MKIEALLEQTGWLRGLAHRLVADAALAEDLVQETWVRALTHPPRSESSARAWLRRVIVNLAGQHARSAGARSRRERAREETRPTDHRSAPPTADVVARVQVQRELVESVLELEEPYREVLLLRFFEGLDAAAIARRQKTTPSTVRTRQKRALEQLREKLRARHGDEPTAWLAALVPLLDRLPDASVGAATAETAVGAGAGSTGRYVAAIAATVTVSLVALTLWWRQPSEPLVPRDDPGVATAARFDDPSATTTQSSRATPESLETTKETTEPIETAGDARLDPVAQPEPEPTTVVRVLIDDEPASQGGHVILATDERWIPNDPWDSDRELRFAEIGPDGIATFEGIRMKRGTVAVDLGGGGVLLQKRAHVRPDPDAEIVVRLGTARLDGRVFRAPRVPAAGAVVILGVREDWNYSALTARVVLGSDGAFVMDHLPARSFWVHAEVEGSTSEEMRSHGSLEPGETRSIFLGDSLERFARVGVLRTRSGHPVEVRDVEGVARIELVRDVDGQREVYPLDLGGDGRFRVEIPAGRYAVRVRLPSHSRSVELPRPVVVDAFDDSELDVRLSGARLSGTAYDASTGLPRTSGAIALHGDASSTYRVTIGEDGSFVFVAIPPGEYRLQSSGDGSGEVEVSIGPDDLELRSDLWIDERS